MTLTTHGPAMFEPIPGMPDAPELLARAAERIKGADLPVLIRDALVYLLDQATGDIDTCQIEHPDGVCRLCGEGDYPGALTLADIPDAGARAS